VVLRDQGVLTLRDGFDPAKGTATLADITGYRKKVQLVEAASVVLARSLEDLDASAIVNTFAWQAGLIATRDGLAVEKRENNPYVNIIVVREQDRGAAWVAPLVKSYQSPEVRAFIESKYQGSVVPAF
jgi:D-methionine transport system substrate-binding protein